MMKIRLILCFIILFPNSIIPHVNARTEIQDNIYIFDNKTCHYSNLLFQKDIFEDCSSLPSQTSSKVTVEEEISQIKKIPVKVHSSFVKDLRNNKFEVAGDIQKVVPTLIDMNLLTYIMRRGENEKIVSMAETFAEQGWEIRPFSSFSGKNNRIEDIPGFVAYNRLTNQFSIAIRGSQTKDDEISSADWEVNFDAQMIETEYGRMHRGFYQRTFTMMDDIVAQLKYFYKDISIENRKDARILVTGHSQGAALATLVSARLSETLKDDLMLGKDFDNKKSNTIIAYLLSAPRVGDQKAREWIHATVGKENMIRQNVTGGFLADPVPSGSPGKTLTKLLSKIPFVGDNLALKYGGEGGAASVGYLAADLPKDVLTRRISPETKALAKRSGQRIGATTSDLVGDLKRNPINFFKRLAPVSLNTALAIGKDALETYFSGLHYGGTMDQSKPGAYFQSNVVAGYMPNTPTLDKLLEQGAKKKQQSGLFGRIKGLFS